MSFQNPIPAGIRQVVPDYVSDGVTTAFGFPWRLFNVIDLLVEVLPPGATAWAGLSLGPNYTIAVNGTNSATVNLVVAQPAGTLVRLQGLRVPERLTSVVNDGVVQSLPLETEFDALEATAQELRRDVAALQAAVALLSASYGGSFANLPTTLPPTRGVLWNNGGVLCVS